MNQESQRVMETKDKIKDAFYELYATKKIERISIKEITEKAQLNRGTFYVYYKDIYDLLEKSEDEFIEELINKIKGVATMILRDEDILAFLPPLEFYQRYAKYLRVLLGHNGDPHFIFKIKTIIKKTLKELIQQENVPTVPHMDYVMEYMASAQIGLISYWMQNDMDLSIEEIGGMSKQFILHGPIGFLKRQPAGLDTQSGCLDT